MRLAEFIVRNREPILAEWEEFARSCAPASGSMDVEALRDHADEMLTAIAADLRTPQDRVEQADKSKGHAHAPQPEDSPDTTAAEHHGEGRAESGFSVEQMIAEYRALRASVIRLWSDEKGGLVQSDIEDLTRFNEAIDQSLAESVANFNENVEQSKEVFLGILGHDLRTPLSAISTSASVILERSILEEPYRGLLERIGSSATRTIQMVGDLLDFTRSRLGDGIPIVRADVTLGSLVQEVVDEVSASRPPCPIRLEVRRDQQGQWDAARLRQALSNLIGNAVQHGPEGAAVTVAIDGAQEEAAIAVHNEGAGIPSAELDGIFNPMKPRDSVRQASASGPTGSLGLGLYISQQIASAHGGRIEVESSDTGGTTFTMYLPRHEKSGPQPPKSA